MKKVIFSTFIILSLMLLDACNEPTNKDQKNSTKDNIEEPKEGKIVVGTDIKSIVKATNKDSQNEEPKNTTKAELETKGAVKENSEYQTITWQNLEIPGKGAEEIIKKFEKEIDSIPEGSLREKEILGRLQAALNSAPVNEALDKKRIKLAGFVSPLEIDDKKGVVKEFLLVPYFGACIHVPPPPLNQTLLVKPKADQQIKLEDAYEPVWVSGVIHAETTSTKLAEAGYKISDIKIEPYREHLENPE